MERDDDLDIDFGYDDVTHTPVVLKTEFFPWHKPRKQYIRMEQWSSGVSSLIAALGLEEGGRPLEYLSLPGPDLLDLRAVYKVCEEKKVKIKFTGLNHIPPERKAELADQLISLDEMKSKDYVDNSSDVYPDKLENLSKTDSVAYQKVIKLSRTYDVINIDLCDSFLGTPPKEAQDGYYQALFSLLRYQAEHRSNDWLFYITSRTNRDMVNDETFSRFIKALEDIFDIDEDLYARVEGNNIFSPGALVQKRFVADELDCRSVSHIVSAGIGKWVLGSLTSTPPAHKSSMMKLFSYNVSLKETSYDMVSLGFWCKKIPTPAEDPLGLANGVNLGKESSESVQRKCMDRVFKSLSEVLDVDRELTDDAKFNSYLQASADLMQAARYDRDRYIDWAKNEHKLVVAALQERA
ncbi:hypothetical protein ACN5ZH_000298 [Pseudomonas aeruginosa]|uniref:PP_RS20740 family protein n=1 Tax=Pseudomonas aeruginosa TaxID=287 RepID=UPI000F88BD1D|nr:hypothetical protein [Pseudomonas aeruginosa]RUJ02805.1 hypothetical protein IPC392_07490 [Pseudomonas aeruginosa]HCF5299499.1 hypothetical protein [Pseudomonas aeruginosa]